MLVNKTILSLQNVKFTIFNEPTESFSSLTIPKTSLDDLIALLNNFKLNKFEDDFLTLIAIIQHNFILYDEKFEGNLYEDFLKDKEAFKSLMNVLEIYLFDEKKELNSISFKFITKKTITLKNFFIVDDIYKVFLKNYGLNKKNFQSRKQELLTDYYSTNFNFKKGGDYVISQSIKALFNFLQEKNIDITDNDTLRFCGVFLHICQIPSNKKNDDVMVGDIENIIKTIDPKNLRHYINDRPIFFTNETESL
jgi:hypothetical protein